MAERPEFVAAQNPSIVLAALVVFLRPIFGYKVLIDAHNSGIYPAEGKSFFLKRISNWLQCEANLTIVTNQELKSVVESNGGKAFVLPDRLPKVQQTPDLHLDGKTNIVLVCTFGVDEPYAEVFKAAQMISTDIMLYVTGRYDGKVDPHQVTANVKLVGFVPDDEFWALLSSSNFIMDLTVREGCLVCGAYEGVALLKPLILSDTKVLRSYFSEGCVYVSPNAESIAGGINEAIQNTERLQSGIRRLKIRLEDSWKSTLKDLVRMIASMK
jgi:hypothetical protein